MLFFEIPKDDYDFLNSVDTTLFDDVKNVVVKGDNVKIYFEDDKQLSQFQVDMSSAQIYFGMTPDDELTGIGRRMQDIYDWYFVIRKR